MAKCCFLLGLQEHLIRHDMRLSSKSPWTIQASVTFKTTSLSNHVFHEAAKLGLFITSAMKYNKCYIHYVTHQNFKYKES